MVYAYFTLRVLQSTSMRTQPYTCSILRIPCSTRYSLYTYATLHVFYSTCSLLYSYSTVEYSTVRVLYCTHTQYYICNFTVKGFCMKLFNKHLEKINWNSFCNWKFHFNNRHELFCHSNMRYYQHNTVDYYFWSVNTCTTFQLKFILMPSINFPFRN